MNHQDEKPIIYLIGARGAGKTTVGKPLAQALLYDFIDTDACVTEQCRMSISQLVEQSGWRSFRELESDVLRQVSKPHRLVSTGGGIVMAPENRVYAILRQSGISARQCRNPGGKAVTHPSGTSAPEPDRQVHCGGDGGSAEQARAALSGMRGYRGGCHLSGTGTHQSDLHPYPHCSIVPATVLL